jgi:creatinine amidohydrolase
MLKRPVSMLRVNHKQLKEFPPNVAILPWGAMEAHNQHLPYGSDVIEASKIAELAAEMASEEGAKVIVYPPIPFGNNAQQLDQIGTIHISTTTTYAILRDVCSSLDRQNIDRLLIVNSHGGNDFKPLIRDLQNEYPLLIILVDLHFMIPDLVQELFQNPGDHAGELETSFLLALNPKEVFLKQAGPGKRISFDIKSLNQAGIWTPRPWSQIHPDLGSGDPQNASLEKGKCYVETLTQELKKVILELSSAKKGDLPYIHSKIS